MPNVTEERFKVVSLEKMIHVIAILIDTARLEHADKLCENDLDQLMAGKV